MFINFKVNKLRGLRHVLVLLVILASIVNPAHQVLDTHLQTEDHLHLAFLASVMVIRIFAILTQVGNLK